MGDEFKVNITDLTVNNGVNVVIECDFCHTICHKPYGRINKHSKHCCDKNECLQKRTKQTNFERYGVESPVQRKEVQEKMKNTMMKRYGSEHALQCEEFKDKYRKTSIERFGVECNLGSKEERIKHEEIMLEKYGVKHQMLSDDIKNKIKNNNLEKYGVEYTLQIKEVREQICETNLEKYGVKCNLSININERIIKANQTMYNNGTGLCSTQQQYICDLYNIKPNYPVDTLKLDIAFPNEMLYIEYDGSGHDLCVDRSCSRNEFNRKEIDRIYFLKNRGWKLIRIISKKNWLPSDEVILNLIDECRDYLFNENHSWIEIDIDKGEIRSSKLNKQIKLGELRKIKKEDIE